MVGYLMHNFMERFWTKCYKLKKTKLRGFSPQANYTDRLPLVGEVSANFLRIESVAWSSQRIPTAVILRVSRPGAATFPFK
jgi:hypothetical protein